MENPTEETKGMLFNPERPYDYLLVHWKVDERKTTNSYGKTSVSRGLSKLKADFKILHIWEL